LVKTMEGYNAPKDEGYSVKSSYGSNKQAQSNSYGNSQTSTVALPIYEETQQQVKHRRSRCPRGALLGQIGSCCGDRCTRACAIES